MDNKRLMSNDFLERFLEELEETSFPLQVDWNNKELYIKGLKVAMLKAIEGEALLLD